MKITEKILGSLFIIGLILGLADIPGGSTLTILVAGMLAMFYMAASFFLFKDAESHIIINGNAFPKNNPLRVAGTIATGVALSTTIIGILFNAMHWPGAFFQLIAGLGSLLIIAVICAIKYSKSKSEFYKKPGIRIGVFGIIGLLFMFVF